MGFDALTAGAEPNPALRTHSCLFWVVWPNNHHAKDISPLAADLGRLQTGGSEPLHPIASPLSHACLLAKLHPFQVAAEREEVALPIRRQWDMTALF